MDTINIHFNGPFGFMNKTNSLFECQYVQSPGVYLWTIKSNMGNLIHYIGETVQFAKRQKEHLINILGLNYGIFDTSQAQEGKQVLIWKGLWRYKSENPIEELLINYVKLSSKVIEYINSLNVFFALIDTDNNTRRHIEGSIGWNLRNKYKDKFDILYPSDNHVGTSSEKMNKKLLISSDEIICGLDAEIDL
jgi:hypothetical protein